MPFLQLSSLQSRLIFALFYGKLSDRIHAAGSRVFTSANCPVWDGDCRPAEAVDTELVAGPGPLRRDTAVADTCLCAGPGQVESARYFSLRRCVRRDGSSPAGNDSRLRRSRIVRTLQMALHLRAVVSAGNLCRVLLVGPERHPAGCFLLGRLARIDADLRFLPHLRRKNRNL